MGYFQGDVPHDLRDFFAAFDDVTLGDLTPYGGAIPFIGYTAVFTFELTVDGLSYDVLYVQFDGLGVDYTFLADIDLTTGAYGDLFKIDVFGAFEVGGTRTLTELMASDSRDGTGSWLFNDAPGYEIEGFAGDDLISGLGVLRGKGGNDLISMGPPDTLAGGEPPPLTAQPIGFAYGGNGDDYLDSLGIHGVLRGGRGEDELLGISGRVKMAGGADADMFRFDNGPSFYPDFDDMTLRAFIRDFDPSAETIILSQSDSGVREEVALNTLVGDVSLDQVAKFEIDGLTYRFFETDKGDAVIRRVGTTSEGGTHDERITVRGLGLEEIDAADVVLWLDADDVFAFV